jgi:hypothetical protein
MKLVKYRNQKPYRAASILTVLVALIAILRIVSAYPSISQAYDEPAHIACGMEWLDKGTFVLEPLHPPLARVAAAIGPYLAGARLPEVRMIRDKTGDSYDIYSAGNEILNAQNRYRRTLVLSRLGELPLFCLSIFVVFTWARNLFGVWPALFSVVLFTTLPAILAFAGLAYVDFSLATFLPLSLLAFTRWLERPSTVGAIFLGLAAGLAVLSNFTALLFMPVCLLTIALCWWLASTSADGTKPTWPRLAGDGLLVVLIAFFVIWAGYRFSVQSLDRVFAKPAQDIAAVNGLPAPIKTLALKAVALNPPVPAPQFVKGLVDAWMFNKTSPSSYALGKTKRGGFWYFYWLDLGVKTPLAFLLLSGTGIAYAFMAVRPRRDWRIIAPAASVILVLLASMVVKVDLGIRHILFIYPLLAVSTAGAVGALRELRPRWSALGWSMFFLLVTWQVVSAAAAHPDYISYFNEIARSHPEHFFVFGCDLDCGQDVERLSQAVRSRGISHLSLRLWTSADLRRLNLPPFETLQPYQLANGWVAVSLLHLQSGEEIWNRGSRDGYSWLNSYKPVAAVGKTIRLYDIHDSANPGEK